MRPPSGCSGLIEDLLVFSRVATQTRSFVAVDLGQVAREVLEDLDDLVRRSRAVVRVGSLPTIDADPAQMRQLFLNLFSNALKFRREGVRPQIDISATVARRGRQPGCARQRDRL
jgi:light-regulated signal transduction histidine kinase (bacteriophytochrome)